MNIFSVSYRIKVVQKLAAKYHLCHCISSYSVVLMNAVIIFVCVCVCVCDQIYENGCSVCVCVCVCVCDQSQIHENVCTSSPKNTCIQTDLCIYLERGSWLDRFKEFSVGDVMIVLAVCKI